MKKVGVVIAALPRFLEEIASIIKKPPKIKSKKLTNSLSVITLRKGQAVYVEGGQDKSYFYYILNGRVVLNVMNYSSLNEKASPDIILEAEKAKMKQLKAYETLLGRLHVDKEFRSFVDSKLQKSIKQTMRMIWCLVDRESW